ncbi:MAG: hypothetical protein ACRDNE_12325 [Gaiellaceae bacterium]
MNPFVTDRPPGPQELIDREAEASKLLELATGGHNSRLSAPRRYGKTTLLGRVRQDAEQAGLATVYVDFYGVVSLEEIVVRIEEAYRQGLQGPLARWLAAVLRTWRPSLRAGAPGISVRLEHAPEPETVRLLQKLLDLPLGLHEKSGKRTLVIFDEFQALLSADDTVDGLIRSRIQHQRDQASYVFAGSHPGLMAELFDVRGRPLFGQARPVPLGPLDDELLGEYVAERFEDGGKDVGTALGPLLDLVRGHPQRAMLAAHHLWEQTTQGSSANEETWAAAVRSMFSEVQESFERFWEGLSPNQRRVLTAVAWVGPWGGGDAFYGRSTLARFKLAAGTARDVRRALVKTGDLEEAAAGIRLVDPLLEAWIGSGRRPPS